jgi:DNA-directed RNA polymerase II subunit RPB1
VTAASKGNITNLAQVMSGLGQQCVEGERVQPCALTRRTLPMFAPGALSAAARGYVSSAYLDGMTPHEYWFHMQGGREGLVATAVKTAETGHKYRSMAKAMETNTVQWDGTVRNAQDYVLELVAGGDYMSPTRVERVRLDVLTLDDAGVAAAFVTTRRRRRGGADPDPDASTSDDDPDDDDPDADAAVALDRAVARVRELRDALRAALLTPLYPELDARLLVPVNVPDELRRVRHDIVSSRARHNVQTAERTGTAALLRGVDELVSRVLALLPSPDAGIALELALRWGLRPPALVSARVNAFALQHMVAPLLYARVALALAQPGDSVGILAAQSIGEPSTQFTLNVFHQAGQLQRRMTLGVPRLKELVHASAHIRTPTMLVPFRDAGTPARTRRSLAATLPFLCIDGVLQSSYLQHDPAGDGVRTPVTSLFKDAALMTYTTRLHGTETDAAAAHGPHHVPSPWIVRLVLNRSALHEHAHTPETIARAIVQQLPEYELLVVYAQPNMARWVLRVRLLHDRALPAHESEAATRELHRQMRARVLLGGVCGITAARVLDVPRTHVDVASGALSRATESVVDTEGSALMRIATRDWADWERTVTNDVCEVVRVLGLAAGRAVLFAELDRVVSYDGGYVDARHIRQVVATMTHRGVLMPFTRHGINRVDFSVLHRTSFEEPVEMLLGGATVAASEPLRGMCECVAFGQRPAVGTGTVAVQDDVGVRRFEQDERLVVASREQRGLPGQSKVFRKRIGGARGGPSSGPGPHSGAEPGYGSGFGSGFGSGPSADADASASASSVLQRLRNAMHSDAGAIVQSAFSNNPHIGNAAAVSVPRHNSFVPGLFGAATATQQHAFRPSSPSPAMLAQLSACSTATR